MTKRTTQCARCTHAMPAQSSVGRLLGLPKPKEPYACGALGEVSRELSGLAGTVAAMLPVMAKRQECPRYEEMQGCNEPDSYRSVDLADLPTKRGAA